MRLKALATAEMQAARGVDGGKAAVDSGVAGTGLAVDGARTGAQAGVDGGTALGQAGVGGGKAVVGAAGTSLGGIGKAGMDGAQAGADTVVVKNGGGGGSGGGGGGGLFKSLWGGGK